MPCGPETLDQPPNPEAGRPQQSLLRSKHRTRAPVPSWLHLIAHVAHPSTSGVCGLGAPCRPVSAWAAASPSQKPPGPPPPPASLSGRRPLTAPLFLARDVSHAMVLPSFHASVGPVPLWSLEPNHN